MSPIQAFDLWLAEVNRVGHPFLNPPPAREAYESCRDNQRLSNRDRTVWPTHVSYTSIVRSYNYFCRDKKVPMPKLTQADVAILLRARFILGSHRELRVKDNTTGWSSIVRVRPWPSKEDVDAYVRKKQDLQMSA